MDQIGAYDASVDALTFFRAELKKAGPISSALLPEFGRLWSYLPSSAAEKQTLFHLQEGGAFSAEQAHNILQYIVTFSGSFLREKPSNVLLCEDRFFAISDPPNRYEQQVFEHAGVSYHYRTNARDVADSNEIEEAMGCASSYPLILLLTTISSGRHLPQRTAIESDLADELARNVRHVIQGAYDEEGYIIWSNQGNQFVS
jgi:hypothetical protein